MALKLEYRSTFIDVDEGSLASTLIRSRSQPSLARVCTDPVDAHSDENQAKSYVSSLWQRSEQLLFVLKRGSQPKVDKSLLARKDDILPDNEQHTLETCSTTSPLSSVPRARHLRTSSTTSSAVMTTEVGEPQPDANAVAGTFSVPCEGSVGHPEFCRRPCIFFAQGVCTNGSACGYCHMEHTGRETHLDKRNRDFLKRMSLADVLTLVLKLAQQRASKAGIYTRASLVLCVLEKWSSSSSDVAVDASVRRLEHALRNMPFAGLISLVLKHAEVSEKSQPDVDFIGQLRDALAAMRD